MSYHRLSGLVADAGASYGGGVVSTTIAGSDPIIATLQNKLNAWSTVTAVKLKVDGILGQATVDTAVRFGKWYNERKQFPGVANTVPGNVRASASDYIRKLDIVANTSATSAPKPDLISSLFAIGQKAIDRGKTVVLETTPGGATVNVTAKKGVSTSTILIGAGAAALLLVLFMRKKSSPAPGVA